LIVTELLTVFLVPLYENYIVVELVVPRRQALLESLQEIMDANFTYVYLWGGSGHKMVEQIYSTNNSTRTKYLGVDPNVKDIKDMFLSHKTKEIEKDVLSFFRGQDESNRIFGMVKAIAGDQCHLITMNEDFMREGIMFVLFESPVGEVFDAAFSRLEAAGYTPAFASSHKLVYEINAISYARKMSENGPARLIEHKNKEQRHRFITLQHWTGVIKIVAGFLFVECLTVCVEVYLKNALKFRLTYNRTLSSLCKLLSK